MAQGFEFAVQKFCAFGLIEQQTKNNQIWGNEKTELFQPLAFFPNLGKINGFHGKKIPEVGIMPKPVGFYAEESVQDQSRNN